MICGGMSSKGPEITSSVNTELYIQILNNFLVPSIENLFDNIGNLQDDYTFHGKNLSLRIAYQLN